METSFKETVVITLGIVLVVLGIVAAITFGATGADQRAKELQQSCIENGGTLRIGGRYNDFQGCDK